MRVFRYRFEGKEGDEVRFLADADKKATVVIFAIGLLLLGLVPFVERSDNFAPVATVFIIFPAVGIFIAGILLLCYKSETVINTAQRQVKYVERFAGFPLRTLVRRLDDFEDIKPAVGQGGREGKRVNYSVITLSGKINLPLMEVEDYQEARKLCAEMKSGIGIGD